MKAVVAEAEPEERPVPAPAVLVPPWTPDQVRAGTGWAAATTLAVGAVFLVLRVLPSVGWPLLLAVIGAYLFDPLVAAMSRRSSRHRATVALFVLGMALTVGALFFLVPMFVNQARRLPAYLGIAFKSLVPTVEDVIRRPIPGDLRELWDFAEEHLDEIVNRVLPEAGSVLGALLGGSLSVLSSVLGALVVPVVGFFLLRDWPHALEGAESLVPPRQRPFMRERMAEVDRILGGFVRGQLTMVLVLSVLYSAALSLIGLKLAILVGLLTGLGALIPYVGVATGLALACGFCLVDFGLDCHLAAVVGAYALLLTTDSMFITPRVVGNKVGLSPAAVIVAILACGSLFGFAGVLLAVPSAAVLKAVLRVSVQCWRNTRLYRGV